VLVLRGGCVGLLDFGQCKTLSPATRVALAQLYLALRRGPPLRVAAALRALGVRTARDDDVAGQARHAAAMFGTSTSISPADAFGALRLRCGVCMFAGRLLSASSPVQGRAVR